MKRIISVLAVALMAAGAVMAETNGDNGYYKDNGQGHCGYVDPGTFPNMPATCELPEGFGLIALASDQAMFDSIKARLEAGDYVGIQVDNLDIVRVLGAGGYRVIGAVVGHGGMLAICYQTY